MVQIVIEHRSERSLVMSSTRKSDNWLLVEWISGGRNVVYVRSVVSAPKELKIGDALTVNRRGEPEEAKLIARAREREPLDLLIKKESDPGPSGEQPDEPEDFSSSASSWAPSEDDAAAMSADSADEQVKIKLEPARQRQYSNRRSSKKVLTPSHRANAVIPKMMQNTANRKRPLHNILNTIPMKKSLPDSTRHKPHKELGNQKILIDVNEIIKIKDTFTTLFKMLEDIKKPVSDRCFNEKNIPSVLKADMECYDDDKDDENCPSDDFNRSDDNVLITNKYNNAVKTPQVPDEKKNEWVPIGSGKTLIHIDQFRKVNWKSYTIATRTLLLAVFPRRILATHSLTGKRSPAFQNKPAKMCLDPKIISDVIMEIMDRFNVKENLVRGIITTKCADECKMWKSRVMKKKSPKNIPPVINETQPKEVVQ